MYHNPIGHILRFISNIIIIFFPDVCKLPIPQQDGEVFVFKLFCWLSGQHSSKHSEHTKTETDTHIWIFHRSTVVVSLEKGAYLESLHLFRIVILNQSSF